MLIRNHYAQRIIFSVSVIGFITLLIAFFMHNPFLSMLDNLTAQLTFEFLPKKWHPLLNSFFFFSHCFGVLLVIFLLCFFLWGFKYKIPAFWILATSVISGILVHFLNLLLRTENFGHTMQMPTYGIFWATLIYSYMVIFVIPAIQKFRNRLLSELMLLISWFLIFIATIFQDNTQFSGMLAGILFALICLETFEILYVKQAPFYAKMNGFKNSWY